ncbi:hypothetical protein EDB87DRAFT_1582003 [Lactarius vividus]|nr:hypothetical protein EDB87DRAFT_1582003 [Lactarius vividus]
MAASYVFRLSLRVLSEPELRGMEMHVQTDMFYSAAVILPDKAGRILNVGGWMQSSSHSLRLYTPDGSAGVNGTNDREEDPGNFQLQAQTTSIPSSTFFQAVSFSLTVTGYYNEVRLLDPVTVAIVKVLPNIPGSVTNPLASHMYRYEGVSVLLPQHVPYTDESLVMTCGGSCRQITTSMTTYKYFRSLVLSTSDIARTRAILSSDSGDHALDNCVSIQPEAANPTLVIERMPSKRVVPCMVALLNDTFVIMNGAQQGAAGFDGTDDPNLSALLKDPSQPVGARISILNTMTIARMYHSFTNSSTPICFFASSIPSLRLNEHRQGPSEGRPRSRWLKELQVK